LERLPYAVGGVAIFVRPRTQERNMASPIGRLDGGTIGLKRQTALLQIRVNLRGGQLASSAEGRVGRVYASIGSAA
jgi:hypothetical protein